MSMKHCEPGDAIFARIAIVNDGHVPGAEPGEVFAERGAMGMLINIGHVEENPSQKLYLASFPRADGEMGPPVACLPDELSAEPLMIVD